MLIYSVTIAIQVADEENWFQWMKKTHIPQVMATGMFLYSHMMKTVGAVGGNPTYVVQYYCDSLELYEKYQREFAPTLQAETKRLYGDRFSASRGLFQLV